MTRPARAVLGRALAQQEESGVVLYVARPRHGKTWLMVREGEALARATGWPILAVDTTADPAFDRIGAPRDSAFAAGLDVIRGRRSARFIPTQAREVDVVLRAVSMAGGRVVVLVDEFFRWARLDILGELARLHAHRRVWLLGATQRVVKDIPNDVIAGAPRWRIGPVDCTETLKKLARLGIPLTPSPLTLRKRTFLVPVECGPAGRSLVVDTQGARGL